MSASGEMVQGPAYRDRSVGLVLFGLLEVLMGVLALLMVPMLFAMTMMHVPGQTPPAPRMMAPAAILYGVVGIGFIWLGIGSILARRWARALMLVISWFWLVIGVFSLVFWILWGTELQTEFARQGKQLPPDAMLVAQIVGTATLGCMYLILPGILALFYGGPNVKATCEHRDPRPRWTDRCPLPVLALVLVFAFSWFSLVSAPFYDFTAPVFGRVLTGLPGAALYLGVAILMVYLAWGFYKLRVLAWILAVLLFVVGTASGIVTMLHMDFAGLYAHMGIPQDQVKIITDFLAAKRLSVVWLLGVVSALYLAYLLFVGKYFFAARKERRRAH